MHPLVYLAAGINVIWLAALTVFLFRGRQEKAVGQEKPLTSLRFSLVKFNPFSDTGGEQSFVVSLLDGGGSGILLTSLNGRGISRLYAKRVVAGKVDLELSAEEKQALSQALKEKPVPI